MKSFQQIMLPMLLSLTFAVDADSGVSNQCRELEQEFQSSDNTSTVKLAWYMENCDIEKLLVIDAKYREEYSGQIDRRKHP